uniref:Si:ch211-209f23.6 n=1 Tax=Cyprinus carpio TaxID=7962 RepID=A0A8C1SYB5_CYPCA
MAVDHLFTTFILFLISNTGFSAEISVFVQTGASVQLNIQTQQLPEFDIFAWMNDKSESIVRYNTDSKRINPHDSYKDRVDFNDRTFSVTLKNMQKTDSGLYTARTTGSINTDLASYRVSVIDAVKAPVLTVNSNWFSSDSCTVNFTCRAPELMINSSYQNNRCSPQEVTSHEIHTLILDCSKKYILCNHSNPVSWNEDRINITQLCDGKFTLSYDPSYMFVLLIACVVVGVIVFAGVILYCCCKNKTGLSISNLLKEIISYLNLK